jgi:2-phospho-L-lactate guanylyltransferase
VETRPGLSDRTNDRVSVLVPIRSFDDAKSRLADVLDGTAREALARSMAATVLAAAGQLPVFVVTDDDKVAGWAGVNGAGVIAPAVQGLNESVQAAVETRRVAGDSRVIVAHADLPLAVDLGVVAGRGVAIAPDRHGDGSNVVSVPTDVGFTFRYGPGSYEAHRREAARCRLPVTVIHDPGLSLDVDHPEDLAELHARRPES